MELRTVNSSNNITHTTPLNSFASDPTQRKCSSQVRDDRNGYGGLILRIVTIILTTTSRRPSRAKSLNRLMVHCKMSAMLTD